jgi:hypothetical protein
LLGLLLLPEDGGDMFLRNACFFYITGLNIPEDRNLPVSPNFVEIYYNCEENPNINTEQFAVRSTCISLLIR